MAGFTARVAIRRPVAAKQPRPDWRANLKHVAPLAPLVAALPEELRIEWEERAAIMEYDGGIPRSDAERCAYLEIAVREL